MQRQQKAYVGLDIGTHSTKCLIGVDGEAEGAFQIIGIGVQESEGMRRGAIVNVEEVVDSITKAVDEAERTSGYAIDSATVGINGTHLLSQHSKGVIAVTGGNNREIDEADIERVEEAASVVQIPQNREIVHVFPRSYSLDGQSGIQDPLGMTGVRLEAETMLVSASTPSVKNIQKAMAFVGLGINDQYVNGMAAARIALDKKQQETGTAVIDIGHSTTGIMVFEEKEPLFFAVLPVGSSHITNDIAIGLQIDLGTAEEIKRSYGAIADKAKKQTAVMQDARGEEFTFQPSVVKDIVEARVEELFEGINDQLSRAERLANLPGGLVLCGGGAKLSSIIQLAKATTHLPVKLAVPGNYSGITDNLEQPDMVTVAGLMEYDRLVGVKSHGGLRLNFKKPDLLRTIFERLKP